MPDSYRILSSPVRLTGQPDLGHIASLVATDALVRRARAEGRDVRWFAATLAGDLVGQYAAERELAREGLDRAAIGRGEFVERVRAHEAAARGDLQGLLDQLGVGLDLAAGVTDTEEVSRAARTAFVRLYEAGMVEAAERVVDICPRCATVVERADADPEVLEVEALRVSLPFSDGDGALDVEMVAAELLPGVVAVAVPEDHAAAGRTVDVPLAGKDLPVVPDSDVAAPTVVVPAHDALALELSRRHGLGVAPVLDREGVVIAEGPLHGLPRYAGRAAATELLAVDGRLAGAAPAREPVDRCRRCRTVVVPLLGRHWFLGMDDLEVAAADAVREGLLAFTPASALEPFLERAGAGGDWCLSHQVEAGQPVPVSTCLDCGKVAVSVEPPDSCNRCMGSLEADPGVLDARFVGAVWSLATLSWPDDESAVAAAAPDTTLVVSPPGVGSWALPIAALGLRLAGAVPFARVAVNDWTFPDAEAVDLRALLDAEGPKVVRAALIAGGLDLDAARAVVAAADQAPEGEADVDALMAAFETAVDSGSLGPAFTLLANVLAEGAPPTAAGRVRALAASIFGD